MNSKGNLSLPYTKINIPNAHTVTIKPKLFKETQAIIPFFEITTKALLPLNNFTWNQTKTQLTVNAPIENIRSPSSIMHVKYKLIVQFDV